MAKALRERVGKEYRGRQRTRKAVHGECTVELAKWTFPIRSLCREPYEAKVSRTGLTGGMGRRTVRQRALCLPSDNSIGPRIRYNPPVSPPSEGGCHDSTPFVLPVGGLGTPGAVCQATCSLPQPMRDRTGNVSHTHHTAASTLQGAQALCRPHPQALLCPV